MPSGNDAKCAWFHARRQRLVGGSAKCQGIEESRNLGGFSCFQSSHPVRLAAFGPLTAKDAKDAKFHRDRARLRLRFPAPNLHPFRGYEDPQPSVPATPPPGSWFQPPGRQPGSTAQHNCSSRAAAKVEKARLLSGSCCRIVWMAPGHPPSTLIGSVPGCISRSR